MPWQTAFEDPVPIDRGRQLVTLEDAARYIQRLPKAEQKHAAWQTAIAALILVAERGGHTLLPRIAVMQALNRDRPKPGSEGRKTRKKPAKVYRVIR